jgi:hypothetical protein
MKERRTKLIANRALKFSAGLKSFRRCYVGISKSEERMNQFHPNCGQIANSGPPSKTGRMVAGSERLLVGREPENASQADKCGNQKRDLIALWLFITISFAAFVLGAYGIWARCHAESPAFPSVHP